MNILNWVAAHPYASVLWLWGACWVISAWVYVSQSPPELTYCDGCKRFSRGNVCPHC